MKIALINLPLDNNYGGNLQRYALMTVLKSMNHEVVHVQLLHKFNLPFWKKPLVYAKRLICKIKQPEIKIFLEQYLKDTYNNKLQVIYPFYNKYIEHTPEVYRFEDVRCMIDGKYDAYIVGSDQVWRKSMTSGQLANYYFDFLSDKTGLRIAYSVSFGNDILDYTKKDVHHLNTLYRQFNSVSTRELSGLNILNAYAFDYPKAKQTLDPTFLLDKEDYFQLMDNDEKLRTSKNKIFCYILDLDKNKLNLIEKKCMELGLDKIISGITSEYHISIPQWLKYINEAEYIITDSYHGVVFSIIFRKHFLFVGNVHRGNDRILSLEKIFGVNSINVISYTDEFEKTLSDAKRTSLDFLSSSLNNQQL